MPDFTEIFKNSKGQPVSYKGKIICLVDKFSVENGDILIASIEKASSERREGFCIDVTGYFEINGEKIQKGKKVKLNLWYDTMPKDLKIKVFTKTGFVWIYNIWEKNNSYIMNTQDGKPITKHSVSTEAWYNGAAMIVEEIENGRRYFCNDGRPDENFDDIVFTVQKNI